jgi:hypothetical protein
VQHDFDPLARGKTDPDRAGRKGARALLADWDRLGDKEAERQLKAHELKVWGFWKSVRALRNDVAHAGFSHNPVPSEDLIGEAEDTLYKIAGFFDPHT